ncbi:glutamic acid-rich protein-like [Brassica napus]|uniref:glutamic acid-rich protein-like n=1 Tax=Brassica napus TaxID=3708 RepID=UPI0006AAAD5F|nr:glutamic acid-rich protein-like [Brassica napus]
MDPKQPVVLQLLESLKDSYMSNDFKTCQQLLGQLKDIVDQKASLDGTDNEQQQLGELSNPPLDMKSVDPSLWEVEDAEDDQDQELDDYNKIPYDAEWIAKTNCVEYPATIDVKEDNKEEDNAKEDEEEDDDSGAEEDEEYVVDEESSEEDEEDDDAKEDDDSDAEKDEDYEVDEEEDDDSGSEEDEEIQQPLRRSSRIKNVK